MTLTSHIPYHIVRIYDIGMRGKLISGATLTSKGQITIPKDVRDRLGIGAGDRVEFVEIESGVFKFLPATNDITALKGIIPKSKKSVSLQNMNDAIKKRAGNRR